MFARDFPVNLADIQVETEMDAASVDKNALVGQKTGAAAANTNIRARVLASSNSSEAYNTGASGNSPSKRANNNKMGANAKPDTRLSRDPLRGELKFKQIKLTNKKTHFEVNLLVRRQ